MGRLTHVVLFAAICLSHRGGFAVNAQGVHAEPHASEADEVDVDRSPDVDAAVAAPLDEPVAALAADADAPADATPSRVSASRLRPRGPKPATVITRTLGLYGASTLALSPIWEPGRVRRTPSPSRAAPLRASRTRRADSARALARPPRARLATSSHPICLPLPTLP
jgi:hypothetical protein